jgi:cobalt/nickel transport protein
MTISSTTSPVIFQTENFLMLQLKKLFKPLLLATSCALSFSAHAHFQLLYTPDLLRAKGGQVNLKLPFTHPAASGHVMPVDKPEAFYMIKKGKKTDLIHTISDIEWESAVDKGHAYQADVKLRGLGDYVFIVQPSPYFEAEEDIYIQQLTKTIVNVGNLPTDWNEDFNLSAEIVPLTKPYAIYEGGIFSAVVKSKGEPVPFAAIEVEFMNYVPDMQKNQFAKEPIMTPPADVFITQTIYADANGTFHFSLLKAGQWGFAALGIGTEKTYKGKELSQDAVIWVQATKLP